MTAIGFSVSFPISRRFFWFVYVVDSGLGTSISRNATLQYKRPESARISRLLSVLCTRLQWLICSKVRVKTSERR